MMRNKSWSARHGIRAGLALCLLSSLAMAQDDGEVTEGWKDSAELSFVKTAGNTDTSTLGFKNKTWRRWEKKAAEINLGGVRAESAPGRFAVQAVPGGPIEVVEPDAELVSENYWLNGKYYQEIQPRFYWQVGGGWDRDQFAGVNNRFMAFGGVGNLWIDNDKRMWRTDYSLSYTVQDDVVDDPTRDESYGGILVTSNFQLNFAKSSSYGNDTGFNFNIEETADWRMVMDNWVNVTMTTHLALKVNLQWRYSNDPRLETIDLFDGINANIGTYATELEKLDSVLTASLVVNF